MSLHPGFMLGSNLIHVRRVIIVFSKIALIRSRPSADGREQTPEVFTGANAKRPDSTWGHVISTWALQQTTFNLSLMNQNYCKSEQYTLLILQTMRSLKAHVS